MAGRPLRPATDHRLGRLLPHQLANRPRAHPQAPLLPKKKEALLTPLKGPAYAVLSAISRRYPSLAGRSPTCYSPVRHSLLFLAKGEDVRLACVRHAASVYPEPGSNSPSNGYVYPLLYRRACICIVSRDPGHVTSCNAWLVRRFSSMDALCVCIHPLTGDCSFQQSLCVLLSTLQLSRYCLE